MNREKMLALLDSSSNIDVLRVQDNYHQNTKQYAQRIKIMNKSDNINIPSTWISFIDEFSEIEFMRTEKQSGDTLHITIRFRNIVTNPKTKKSVAFIGRVGNACGTIERFFITEDGMFYATQGDKYRIDTGCYISDSVDEFIDYLITREYDYHIPISEETYQKLKNAGWYDGRQTDISEIIKTAEEHNVDLTEAQKEFLKEFAGIESPKPFDNHSFFIATGRSHEGTEFFYENPNDDLPAADRSSAEYRRVTVRIGWCDGFTCELGLSPDGLLVHDCSPEGRSVMEGWELILN